MADYPWPGSFRDYRGHGAQLARQALGVAVAIVFAGVGSFVIGALIRRTVGLRVADEIERDGLDIHVHGERGYHPDQA